MLDEEPLVLGLLLDGLSVFAMTLAERTLRKRSDAYSCKPKEPVPTRPPRAPMR